MGSTSKLQSSRFEFKYVVDEPTAREIHRFVRGYLEPDAYTVGREGAGYPVHSLYLDSTDLFTCRATQHGEKNRFKLRLRFYGEDEDSPVFLEIKRRENVVIMKQRAAVRRSAIQRLLAGEWLDYGCLLKDDEKNRHALHNFCFLCRKIHARPAAYTSYLREGYEPSGSNTVRVTFDRDLRAGRFSGSLTVADLQRWSRPDVGGVVLELKFTDRFPNWMHTLTETFNLQRTSVPKYVECVTLLNGEAYVPLQGPSYESDLPDEPPPHRRANGEFTSSSLDPFRDSATFGDGLVDTR